MRLTTMLAPLLCLLSPTPASAQDESAALDQIVVTGSRVTYRDLLDTPAIGLTKQGDHLLQSITLVNDTRSEDGRRRELHDTIAKLIAAAGSRYRLLHGDSYPVILDRDNHRVELRDDAKRPDASRVTLQVRAEIVPASVSSGESQVRALREFVQRAARSGRTEIDMADETSLSLNRPERFRHELIQAIAEDSRRVAATLGGGCSITLEGLNSRIDWERVGPTELLLYLPYSMTVRGCRAGGEAPAD